MESHHFTARSRRSCLAAAACVLVAAVWQGCTATKDNYATLRMFFDGVPDPTLATSTIDPKTGEIKERGTVSLHKPFEKDQCSECHGGRELLNRNSSFVCMKCHENQLTQHERMHGPVAAGACLWCHAPHESLRAHLMRDTDRKVCGQCHVPSALDAVRVPGHSDDKRACLECHTGHGGPKAFMLRTDAIPGQEPLPATEPLAGTGAAEPPSAPAAPAQPAPAEPGADDPAEPAEPADAPGSVAPSPARGNEGGR